MKKAFLVIGLLLIIFLTGCGTFNLNGWICPDDLEFIALIEELDTPRKISTYMIDNFIYEKHDFWTPNPYFLWKRGKGDCNDFSAFGVFVADHHGYETYQIKIYDNTWFKHYVAVYVEDIWYSITDNQYYHFGFDDFREIVDYVCDIRLKDWTRYIVYDYWNDEVEIGYK